jgi:carboxymethylenebutenolidase
MVMKQFIILCLLALSTIATCGCQERADDGSSNGVAVVSSSVDIQSGNRTYPAYLALPEGEGPWPGIVLLHSFGGLHAGYRNLTDKLASEGYVVIAPEWLTFERPSDAVMEGIVRDSVRFLEDRDDVNEDLLGLTGFCAGGRYTMLFLPQIEEFNSGVAWYGFPYRESSTNETAPAGYIDELDVPMLIIHGTADQSSNVTDIYRYATDLDRAGKYFEMKIYQGEPHEFLMTEEDEISESFPAKDAYWQMTTFFNRTLQRM